MIVFPEERQQEGAAAVTGDGVAADVAAARPVVGKALARAEERKRRAQPADVRTYRLGRACMRLLFGLFVGPEVVGAEHIPATGPVLVVGNHLSYLEPPLVTALLPRRVTFLALYELFAIWWLAPILRLMGALPVKRGGARDLDAIRAALELLRHGEAVGIFPEGMRSGRAGLLRGNPGVSLLAARSGAPILPVAITGAERLGSAGAFCFARFRRPRVRVVVGRPFRPDYAAGRVDHQAAADQIMGEIAALLPAEYRGVYGYERITAETQRAQSSQREDRRSAHQ